MWNIFQQNDKGYEIISSAKDDEFTHQRGNPYQYEKFANAGINSRPESSLFDFERAEDDPHLAEIEAKKEKTNASRNTIGVVIALCAGLMYGIQSVVVKQATLEGISITECLLTRSVFQVAVMPLVSLCSSMNFFVPKHHHRNVFFICTWYTFASSSVFGAFSLILPDAAVAGRSASRTIISVILTVVTLKEAVTALQLCALSIAVLGMVLMGISTTQLNDFYVTNSWRIVGGFFLCFLGGLFRSIGFTRYRQIKEEVSAEAIVFWHALQSCCLNVPVTLIFQNYSIPSAIGGKWLMALCLTATGGTLGSNKALQFTNPGLVSMAQSIDLTVSTVVEHYFFLKSPPRPLEYLGATLIFSAGMMIPFVKAWKATFPGKEDPEPALQNRERLRSAPDSEETD